MEKIKIVPLKWKPLKLSVNERLKQYCGIPQHSNRDKIFHKSISFYYAYYIY